MKNISQLLISDLSGEVSHLCHCWQIIRRDGQRFGLTNHDHDLTFADTLFHADAGLNLSVIENRSGLSEYGLDVEGVVGHPLLSDSDLRAGSYDGASVTIYLVNWKDVEKHTVLASGIFGDVSFDDNRFRVVLKSMTAQLAMPAGRLYQKKCAARLGDETCRVSLDSSEFTVAGEIVNFANNWCEVNFSSPRSVHDFAPGWFVSGLLTLTQTGQKLAIRDDQWIDGKRRFFLWDRLPATADEGDAVRLQVGCNKTANQCRDKFSNIINFQGFPYLPSEHALLPIKK